MSPKSIFITTKQIFYSQTSLLRTSSQQQPKQLTPASKVHFECEDGIINFNNGIALLESKISLYHPMLQFLSNSCISTALTKQPSVYYSKYLREFWYTTKRSENFVPLTPKETVRAGLATLGLVDENDPSILSTNLVNSFPLKMKYFSPIWKNDVPLTAHMCKVANLSPEPIKSLIPSFGEVNTDDIVDKSLSETNVQPESSPYPQVADTQPTEELATTVDATQSIDASESVEELGNQLELTNAEKSESTLTFLNIMYTLSLHTGNDTPMFIPPDVDPENSRLC
ncbi:hypothetical protein Tco_1179813 [Tanacetum coccineum]